jgi:hypothetical protein
MRSRKGMEAGAITTVALIILALILILSGSKLYAKTFGSVRESLGAVTSCEGITGALSSEPSFCSPTQVCDDYAAEAAKQNPKLKLAEGHYWSSSFGTSKCPLKDNKEQFCCIQLPKAGFKPPATSTTETASTTQPTAQPTAQPAPVSKLVQCPGASGYQAVCYSGDCSKLAETNPELKPGDGWKWADGGAKGCPPAGAEHKGEVTCCVKLQSGDIDLNKG